MEAPDFTYFMLKKISENPEMAEINSAILSLYERECLMFGGILQVRLSNESFLLWRAVFE